MTEAGDARFMRLALALGARGWGRTWPNPSVGCVIVREGRIVGRGWTQPGGRPHAETKALEQAGTAAHGATAYVSLEPCAHYGRTPPCTNALVAAGIARVVVPLQDPDPRVSGRGLAALREAGIAVSVGCEAEAAERAHRGFLMRQRTGRPMLTLKLAASVDGRIATASGESRWITGPEARHLVHAMRARHDAVLVGAGTARADDPMLNVRDLGPTSQPVRVVAARTLDLDPGGRLGRSARDIPLWLLHDPAATPERRRTEWAELGARLLAVPSAEQGLAPQEMLAALGQEGITRVFCEGGGQLASGFLRAGLVDELAVFSAGVALGADARPALGKLGLHALAEAPRFDLVALRRVGGDALQIWQRRPTDT